MKILKPLLLLLLLLAAQTARAEGRWTFQVGSGGSQSLPTWLKISQDGYRDIELTAHYQTRSFSTQAIYYNLKIGYWEDGAAWEFESLHQKLYLTNKPREVQKFHISHGYNMNTFNRAWEKGSFIYRVGGGFVMTHPETTVRGHAKEDDGGVKGFYISGLSVQGAVEKRWYVYKDLFASVEAKLTLADAIIPVWGGEAHVPNVALHAIAGLGYRF